MSQDKKGEIRIPLPVGTILENAEGAYAMVMPGAQLMQVSKEEADRLIARREGMVKFNEIRWSLSGSCGNPGCADPECVCALCLKPLGVSDDDETHDPECYGCERCEDNVPIILFRREGENMKQAVFHARCFRAVTQ